MLHGTLPGPARPPLELTAETPVVFPSGARQQEARALARDCLLRVITRCGPDNARDSVQSVNRRTACCLVQQRAGEVLSIRKGRWGREGGGGLEG